MSKAIKYSKIKWYQHPFKRFNQWRAERWLKKHIVDNCNKLLSYDGKQVFKV